MKNIIKCPKCNQEYLPGEIFIPNSFLGQPRDVYREDGKIVNYRGVNQSLTETYTCDNCGHTFDIEAQITYKVESSIANFDEDFVSPLYQNRITLPEE